MSLSPGDIDELVRLQPKILNRSASINQLLERENFHWRSDEVRDELAELLDDLTASARSMAAIVNREDEGGAK
jgi:hypothetical protein